MAENGVIKAQAAHPAFAPSVIGFVERQKTVGRTWLQLPFAIPVVHLTLDGPGVSLCSGLQGPKVVTVDGAHPIFVIALGFSGARTLFQDELVNAAGIVLPLDTPFWTDLQGRLSNARSFEDRVFLTEDALARPLGAVAMPYSRHLEAADAIVQDRWRGTVKGLAEKFAMEERTLRNGFCRTIGWSPKRLMRIARFNRALRSVHPRSWARCPMNDVRLEFSDDSHFYREFFAHAGMSPSTFAAAKRRSGDMLLHNVALPDHPAGLKVHEPDEGELYSILCRRLSHESNRAKNLNMTEGYLPREIDRGFV